MVNRLLIRVLELEFSLVLAFVSSGLVFSINDPVLNATLFYPFGHDIGDAIVPPNDDGSSSQITIDIGFPFFATSNTKLFVNTNGMITFGQAMSTFTPAQFPVSQRMIAPYWCDIDTTRNRGRVYYRQSRDEALLSRATNDVLRSFRSKGLYYFKAQWLFIATWHNVTYYGGDSRSPINSFQAVLVTDGKHSMAMFNYGWISWTTGTADGGSANTGLGGVAAQAGFNAGDSVNFFALPGSRQSTIVEIARETNAGFPGRWIFRIDSAKIESVSACGKNGDCGSHQKLDSSTQQCSDVAPAFDCPKLEGPTVIDRRWVEFYCVITTKETKNEARFNVTFLFNGEPDDYVQSVVIQGPKLRATLHESHLTSRQFGKWISCRVESFWSDSATGETSISVTSENSYYAGLEVSSDVLSVYEGNEKPAELTLRSTIPVTCKSEVEAQGPEPCNLTIRLHSTPNVVLRRNKRATPCTYTLTEADWNETESKAYRADDPIGIYAKMDLSVRSRRLNTLTIDVDRLPNKSSLSGDSFPNMWSKYKLHPVDVYHNDVPHAVCRATGDPNLTTLDRLFYPVYESGEFIYIQTTHGTPVEVHVRHKPCQQVLSCACAVAIREGDIILKVDKCDHNYPHIITPNEIKNLPAGTGITTDTDKTGRRLEMTLPSNLKVFVYVMSWGLNIEIQVTPAEFRRTQGLCGTFDHNSTNDLWVKGQSRPTTRDHLKEVIESWRIPDGASLFKDVLSDLNKDHQSWQNDKQFCICQGDTTISCQSSIQSENDINANYNQKKKSVLKQDGNTIGPIEVVQQKRKRRSVDSESPDLLTDDIDWEYNSTSFYDLVPASPLQPMNFTWPTAKNLTEEEARGHCRRVLWDELPIKAVCENQVNSSDVDGIIEKCVSDIQVSDDLAWANDKISEVEDLCIFETKTANITERNTTVEELAAIVEALQAVVCLPQDCSGHGTCQNGTCHCDKGYIGNDCALSEDTRPNIIRTIGQSACDIDTFRCQKVNFLAENLSSSENLTCKVKVMKMDKSTESFETVASLESLQTASCHLPTEKFLNGFYVSNPTPTVTTASTTDSTNSDEPDFYSLPPGNPTLYYMFSISNNGIHFSNTRSHLVYNSRCLTCDGESCTQKNDACRIRGYCFSNGDVNPFNSECDYCDPFVSNHSWTKRSDPLCDPCSTSQCPKETVCMSHRKGIFRCIEKSEQVSDYTVVLVACLTTAAVVLTVLLVMFAIQFRKHHKTMQNAPNESKPKDT